MRKKSAKSIADIYRKERRKLRKRLSKIQEKLKQALPSEEQTRLLQEAEKSRGELKTVMAMSRVNRKLEQKNIKEQRATIQNSHSQSGFNRIQAKFVSGGLPTLGKKR